MASFLQAASLAPPPPLNPLFLMPSRPTTGQHRRSGPPSLASSSQPLQGKLRPQSAALLSLDSPARGNGATASATTAVATANTSGERVGASSEELIRDLESKVRKVVELKRAESDKLRFAVAKKREDVAKSKLVLQDLIKDSEALGLHYTGNCSNQAEDNGAVDAAGGVLGDLADQIVEEPNRLQPIASISRRPVYSKHSKIDELQNKLQKRMQATHEVQRNALVFEHIKKRLQTECGELTLETNELKARFAELNHFTQELQKKDIAAAEAVSQVQTRLAQQKADMAANLRKYQREVEMRHKWAREKAKFEKYYNDQVQSLLDAQPSQSSGVNVAVLGSTNSAATPGSRRITRLGSPSKSRRHNVIAMNSGETEALEERYRQAFLRIGFGHHSEGVDPEDIIRTWLAHEEIKKELDAKHDEDVERITMLRDQLTKTRSIASENIPLSKRGTSQRLETKEIEISSVERALATVVDQYMFVDQSVRPLKIGLQQILQNITSETVNVDDMAGLEQALMDSIEEMMRLVRENSHDSEAAENHLATEEPQLLQDGTLSTEDGKESEGAHSGVLSAENFTSPFNIRIPPKPKEEYYVLGVNTEQQLPKPADDGKETEELDFDVMDRATVKRIASVLVCTSTGKKNKDGSHDSVHSPAKN